MNQRCSSTLRQKLELISLLIFQCLMAGPGYFMGFAPQRWKEIKTELMHQGSQTLCLSGKWIIDERILL